MLQPLAILLLAAAVCAERPKIKDRSGSLLVRISDIPIGSCGSDSYFGLGIMNGTLEKCDEWQKTERADVEAYEAYKCKHLRMHAHVINGRCVCKTNWKGPICNEYTSCEPGQALVNKVCSSNTCQHDGELGVGSKEIECICKAPWDGRFCERLACWRKTKPGQDKRFANDGTKCKCGRYYTGANCDIVTSCMHNATFADGRCTCLPGFSGEVCDHVCPKGEVTCSSNAFLVTVSLLLSFVARMF